MSKDEEGKKTDGSKGEAPKPESAPSAASSQGLRSWTPAALPPPAADENTSWLRATLAAHFDIKTLIPVPFDGTPGTFLEYFLRLQQADQAMASYGFTMCQRFMEMLKTIEGLPRQYCNLSLRSEDSYLQAISTLKKLYLPQTNAFRTAWRTCLRRQKCEPTWESRSAWHAEAAALFNIASQMDPEDVFRETCFVIMEERMDQGILKDWIETKARYRDENNSIGHTATIDDCLDSVFTTMIRDLQMSQSGECLRTPSPVQQRGRARWPST